MTLEGQRPMVGIAAGAAIVMLVVLNLFLLAGGRYYVVRTPSMGTAAPVGTLILTHRIAYSQIRVGEIIAFHPPTQPGQTYTHRVVAITADGLQTRGDINGAADPWRVTRRDLIGRATVVLPGAGWLVRALPLTVIGGLIVWSLTRTWVTPARRGPARQLGAAVVFMIITIVLRPFVGAAQLTAFSGADGVTRIHVVSTGLLPSRLTPAAGTGSASPVDLKSGETGTVLVHGGPPDHHFRLDVALHLLWWQWAIAVTVALTPLLWTVVVGFRPRPKNRPASHRAVPV